jgi:hypothetical protein
MFLMRATTNPKRHKICVISGYCQVRDLKEIGHIYHGGFELLETYLEFLTVKRGGVVGKGELHGEWKNGQERVLKGKAKDSFHQTFFTDIAEDTGGWILFNGYLTEPSHQIRDIDLDYELHVEKSQNAFSASITLCISETLLQRAEIDQKGLKKLFEDIRDYFGFEVAYLIESSDEALPSLYFSSQITSPHNDEYDIEVAKYIRNNPFGFKNKLYFDAEVLFLSNEFLRANPVWNEIEKKHRSKLIVQEAQDGKYVKLRSSLRSLIKNTELSMD